ncbi:hypothetical protein EA473_21720 [Natrarchaeobius chitinivorans]|uniref:Halobacterial output domain-containing protein n=1 Tax=Natrarchaeobius chitinivorans TaxID=1679083 RepID=A0A3N6P332_NATCH|nr:hypothetical protein EA473_21720 [Natrarchaeobius chitinivorans]
MLQSERVVEQLEKDGLYRLEYDSSADRPSLAVVAAVADISQTDPVELAPLHSAVDTDALENLVQPSNGSSRNKRRVSFQFAGYKISVSSEGIVEVDENNCNSTDTNG